MNTAPENRLVLLTGATGYVGGRLRVEIEEMGLRLRCMARHPRNLRDRVAAATEVVAGDVFDPASLDRALEGVDCAFYLIHSMGSDEDFELKDREAAQAFAAAAARKGVGRIVYLGGLGHDDEGELSPHLRSRQEVGRILRESGVPTIEFRASIVIGSGSLSFELVRALVERLPVMLTPSWTTVEAQPIAIRDLVAYLLAAIDLELDESRVYEIGGADRCSYESLMRQYAKQRGLKRLMLRVPVITPWLSSLWLGLITPIYARVGRKLVESIKHPTVVRDDRALRDFAIGPMDMATAIARALEKEERQIVASRWFDALSSGGEQRSWEGVRFGLRLGDRRSVRVPLRAAEAFRPIRRIGGETGWYAFGRLWRLRGFIDLLIGGVGLRRGRRHPDEVHVGDALDFWRVEAYVPDQLLRLRAEMKLPGRAWLEFEVVEQDGEAEIRQTALFDPVGFGGRAYWYGIYPLHGLVFSGMLRAIAREGLRAAGKATEVSLEVERGEVESRA